MKWNVDSHRDLWDNIKHTNIWFIGVPGKEEKKKVYEKIFQDIILKNFPNMGKRIVTQVQNSESPIQEKSKQKNAKTHINQTKRIKYKEKILNEASEKQ